jgi:hypothetical protein
MARKKVKLAFITNDSRRKATYKKRKTGLMKKVYELSTLCDVDACAIVYRPNEAQPEVWPNNMGALRVLAKFKRMPEIEQSKKMMDQESFIKQRITKTSEQLYKQCLAGKGSVANYMLPDLNNLGVLVDKTIKDICRRIQSLKIETVGKGKGVAAPLM